MYLARKLGRDSTPLCIVQYIYMYLARKTWDLDATGRGPHEPPHGPVKPGQGDTRRRYTICGGYDDTDALPVRGVAELLQSTGHGSPFIAVEESPEVESLLAEAPWCDMVTTSRSKPEQNPYETVITRQERVMAWALGECESRGIPWLFHLDDDELLHFGQPWEETVAQVPPEATCLVVRNVEGVPDNDHSDFTTISRFAVGNETGWPMLAYINGKAAGRVGACSEMGPHRFTGADCPAAPPPRRPRRPAAPPARPPCCPVTHACVP